VLGCAAPEVLHVGDDPVRDGGAAAIGIRVLHVDRPAQSLVKVLTLLDDAGSDA